MKLLYDGQIFDFQQYVSIFAKPNPTLPACFDLWSQAASIMFSEHFPI